MNGGGYISSANQIASGIVLLDPGSDAQGDIYYWNGSALARLPAGTSGYYLQTQGAGANPQWHALQLQVVTGTDTPSNTTAPTTITDTITHGLGRTPSVIIVCATWAPSPPPGGSGSVIQYANGQIMVNSSNVAIGGFSYVLVSSSGNYVIASYAPKAASISATSTDSYGSEVETISIANITSTTFQIVYTATNSSGHNPNTAFPTVTWTCLG